MSAGHISQSRLRAPSSGQWPDREAESRVGEWFLAPMLSSSPSGEIMRVVVGAPTDGLIKVWTGESAANCYTLWVFGLCSPLGGAIDVSVLRAPPRDCWGGAHY